VFDAPDRPELRHTRYRDIGGDVWERWIWEPEANEWRLHRTSTAAEREANPLRCQTGPTERAIERGRELADEMGW
jgi:hypothetical protein